MCICYAQMMSAMLMFVLIALLVCAFIDEEQFLKTHYYTASKRLFMASMMYGAPAIGLLFRPRRCPPLSCSHFSVPADRSGLHHGAGKANALTCLRSLCTPGRWPLASAQF